MQRPATILVADPDLESGRRLRDMLLGRFETVLLCQNGTDTLAALEREPAQVLISELALPDMAGLDLLSRVAERWPGLPVILLAQDASVPEALSALRAGAADFVQKPIAAEEIWHVLSKALTSVERSAEQPPPPPATARIGILGESPVMRQVYATLERAAQGSATVLVRGESGTGKELVARALHDASPRASQPFVKIDCAALPENLLESELFGYERGAFTGAVARKPGRAELADKGTLFLDEIGELSLPLQAKLLRLLQDREFERLGGTKTIRVDLRVVAATHRDLDAMTERGQFRLDLFYRLNVVPLWLPPLRARREDVETLAWHFLETCADQNGRSGISFTAEALRALRTQKWPGNVRQLQNFIERLVVLSPSLVIGESEVRGELARQVTFATQPGTASLGQAAPEAAAKSTAGAAPETGSEIRPLEVEIRAAEKQALERALRATKHNRSLAARLLGVSRSTLYLKLKEHGLL